MKKPPVGTSTTDDPFLNALHLFQQAAKRVPAYKHFLHKNRVDPKKIRTQADFAHIPTVDKKNYISAHSLADLSWDGVLDQTRFISSSSGSTGTPLYWPRGDRQNELAGQLFQNIYEKMFGTKKGTTLWVNMFGLGTWIAGFEFYNATKFVANQGNNIMITTPGIEKNVALDLVRRLSKESDRIVLAGYPPFIKDVLETGIAEGVNWKKYDVFILTGGESFSEIWRARILSLIGKDGSLTAISNIYGMAEIGIVANETPLSVHARQTSGTIPFLTETLCKGGEALPLYQYDPQKRYFEVGLDDALYLTAEGGLPLIRYNTRDRGGIFEYDALAKPIIAQTKSLATKKLLGSSDWKNPFVYLYGRKDLSLSLYAVIIYVENIKHAFETHQDAAHFSGLFSMQVTLNTNFDQELHIVAELGRNKKVSQALAKKTQAHVVRTLQRVNTEYAKLHSAIGHRALPNIRLVAHGELDTIPGRKHRWTKRA